MGEHRPTPFLLILKMGGSVHAIPDVEGVEGAAEHVLVPEHQEGAVLCRQHIPVQLNLKF